MRDEEKTKGQLVKELQEMQKKISELEKAKVNYYQLEEKLQKIIESTANIITKVVETRDPYSIGHQQRVSKLATAIAREMKIPQEKIEGVRIASLVHDIGKINLPTEIVSKPGKLIEVEFNLVKNYPRTGFDILKEVDFPWPIAEIVFQHQEKIDGSGYPRGLKGSEICIEAKILGVSNLIEAMSSYKSYRPALNIEEALVEIAENRNILFDPEVVDASLKLFKEESFKFD